MKVSNQVGVAADNIIHTVEGGTRKTELVNWYLKEIEAEIETVEDLAAKKVLVEKIIERLVDHVSVVIVHVLKLLQY